MNIVVVFTVPIDVESLVILGMGRRGYSNVWTANKQRFNLPQNCVWKPNTDLATAQIEFDATIAELNTARQDNPISNIRCLILSANPWIAKPAIPLSPTK